MKRCMRGDGQQRASPHSRAAPVCIPMRGCRCCCDCSTLTLATARRRCARPCEASRVRLLVQAPVGVLYLYLFRDVPVHLCPVCVFWGGGCVYDHPILFLMKIASYHGLLLYRPSTMCAAGTHASSPKNHLCVCWRHELSVCRDTSPTSTTEGRAVHVFAHLFWLCCGRRAAAVALCADVAAPRPRRCCCVLGWGAGRPSGGHLVIVCPEAAVCGLLCVCGLVIVCLVAVWLFVGRATVCAWNVGMHA